MSLTPIIADILHDPHITHGFFTRIGGVSQGIYDSLNCGIGSNDNTVNVIENRSTIAVHLSGRRDTPLLSCYQIHSDNVITLDSGWTESEKPKADAMVTNQPNIILGILTADCAPVLFYDPVAHVIGAAHAGWKGALYGILENTVAAMAIMMPDGCAAFTIAGPVTAGFVAFFPREIRRAIRHGSGEDIMLIGLVPAPVHIIALFIKSRAFTDIR